MKPVAVYLVDAFTDQPFTGNPAGVVPFAAGLSSSQMQDIARELNVSETAFVCEVDGGFQVRFFTPVSEVDLCGHATIAAFWLLCELGVIKPGSGETRYWQTTKAGILAVDVIAGCQGLPFKIMMSQTLPQTGKTLDTHEITKLEDILGAHPGSVSEFSTRPCIVSTGLPDLIVPFTSREALLSIKPDTNRLADLCRSYKCISVHCFSMETMDPLATVHCRDFAPVVGIPEEAATGTASGATGAYLVANNLVELVEPFTNIICEQGHIMKRPSIIYVEMGLKAGSITSVRVGGGAVTVFEGKIRVNNS